MDVTGPMNVGQLIDVPPGNFTEEDMTDSTAWLAVTLHMPSVELGAAKLAQLDKGETVKLKTLEYMVGTAASIYYGTPTARRFTLLRCAESFGLGKRGLTVLVEGRELVAACLAEEFVEHPETYPSLKLSLRGLPDASPANISFEELAMGYLNDSLTQHPLTFAEDCALRAVVWRFVMAQTNWTSEEVKLLNGKTVSLDPSTEMDLQKERWAWFREIAHGKDGAAQTKP
jgi:hypothetical protein